MLGHAVLEDDTADDDGDRGADVAREAESCGRGGDVAGLDERLQRDERGLEVGAHAKPGNDLIDDEFRPFAAVVGKIDVETWMISESVFPLEASGWSHEACLPSECSLDVSQCS